MVSTLREAWLDTPVVNEQQPVPVVKEKKDILNVTWEGYYETAEHLASKIRDSGWEFNHIVCIARGGMFIGDMISRTFKKPLAVTFTSSYRGENGIEQNKLIVSKHIAMTTDTLEKCVLLIDDLTDTGDTLEKIKSHIQEAYPDVVEIRTAVLWHKTCSKFKPDYYAESVQEHVWIHQPFEHYDKISPEKLKS